MLPLSYGVLIICALVTFPRYINTNHILASLARDPRNAPVVKEGLLYLIEIDLYHLGLRPAIACISSKR